MAALPRLSARTEFRILRAGCGLPRGVQRLLFGAPPRIDGQTLASDMQAFLRLASLTDDTSFSENGALSPERARAKLKRGTAVSGGPPLPMARVEQLEVPGPAGAIPARLYRPRSETSVSALLVYFHSGGGVIGDLDTHDSTVRFLADKAGVAILSVDYRLAPENPFPAAVDDAFAAFRWAAENGEALAVDPSRIAVGGDSAGGNLAGAVSLLARDGGGPQPTMQLLIYPATDPATDTAGEQESRRLFADGFLLTARDTDWFEQNYLPNAEAALDPRFSLLRVDDLSGLAPAYVATAGFDPLRDEGEAYARRMRAAGVRVALRRYPDQVHGFVNFTAFSRSAREATSELAGALRMGLS